MQPSIVVHHFSGNFIDDHNWLTLQMHKFICWGRFLYFVNIVDSVAVAVAVEVVAFAFAYAHKFSQTACVPFGVYGWQK